ncbi:uncharacterized protein PAC_17257 [Phialocephala subalpina]|uniref:Zn(2)-C6 fungal-type domain-containing protein n=1 Tax=Phialocephala subalpina TaxID=576137 RepID=A0A1L7XQX6_9HELO|nr:uncharacterized protein PAC_17257 [Phialocephala subalpina]
MVPGSSDGIASCASSRGSPDPERCRTCQRRKVKCGKERPICANCKRLGLECERITKLRWRDQTMSTRVSSSSVTSERRSIWDPEMNKHDMNGPDPLINKADIPEKSGHCFVNTTPENFFETYKADDAADTSGIRFANKTPENFVKIKIEDPSEVDSSIGTLAAVPAADATLEIFEDYGCLESNPPISRRASLSKAVFSMTAKSVASLDTGASLARRLDFSLGVDPTFQKEFGEDLSSKSMFDHAFLHTRDLQYYNHYRAVIVYNIKVNSRFPSSGVRPFCHSADETEDAFERAAAFFPPLYNAILALSALSMAHRERLDRVDSLQYYHLAVQGLRQYSTLESVNMIYTHYFLMLYEIAACERRTNLELNHMTQLTRLLSWYFTTVATNPSYAFRDQACQKCTEVSMTCVPSNMLYCDMYNLIFQRQSFTIVPDVMVTGFFNSFHANKEDLQIEAGFGEPEFSRKTIMLNVLGGWGELGSCAIRNSSKSHPNLPIAHRVVRETIEAVNKHELIQISDLEPRFQELEKKIKVLDDWCAENAPQMPINIYDEAYTKMPLECQTTFDSAIRQLLIFAHTSIFPQQRKRLTKRREEYMQFLAREILYLARPRWGEIRPIAASNLIAIFMCGTVVASPEEKAEVLKILETMGAEASGRSFVRVINALKELFKEQDKVMKSGGDERSVDWRGQSRVMKLVFIANGNR